MKRIVLLCQQRWCPFELSPARYQLVHELKEKQYEVFLFYPGHVTISDTRNEIKKLINTTGMTASDIRKKIIEINPDKIIAFTYEDAKILYLMPFKLKKTSFIYFNLEIYTPNMEKYIYEGDKKFDFICNIKYVINKIQEIIYTRQCKLFVIQDALRRKTCKKYFIQHKNTICVPNSYTYSEEYMVKEGSRGVVYSGGLNKLQLETLIGSINKIKNTPLTFSGWCDKWFAKQMKPFKNYANIHIFYQVLPPEQVTSFLESYAVGLVWYSRMNDDNIDKIGLASGKLFKHLSIGQPVIVMDAPGISREVVKNKLGIVIHDASELESAYRTIMNNYSFYQKNVLNAYKNKYDYHKAIQPFLKKLEKI